MLLHRLWVTGEVYDPLYNAPRRTPQERPLREISDVAGKKKLKRRWCSQSTDVTTLKWHPGHGFNGPNALRI